MPRARSVSADATYLGAIINRLRTARTWTLEHLARFSSINASYLGVNAADLVADVEQARRQARAAPPSR